jgi:hypothetical protein
VLALGCWFAHRIDRLTVERSNAMARRVLVASIAHLPLLLGCLIVDQVWAAASGYARTSDAVSSAKI